jgi:hypothetical protein
MVVPQVKVVISLTLHLSNSIHLVEVATEEEVVAEEAAEAAMVITIDVRLALA